MRERVKKLLEDFYDLDLGVDYVTDEIMKLFTSEPVTRQVLPLDPHITMEVLGQGEQVLEVKAHYDEFSVQLTPPYSVRHNDQPDDFDIPYDDDCL